jgi:large subunit ribosomal protein L17
MHKKVFGRKLSRNRRSRTALFRSLTKAIILNGRIKTTRAKALSVQRDLDKLMTLVGKESVAARRLALSYLANDRDITDMLFKKYAAATTKRKSGFTRLTTLSRRRGDNALMVSLEWVDAPATVEVKPSKKVKSSKGRSASDRKEKAVTVAK